MTTLLVTLVLDPAHSATVLDRFRNELAPWLRRLPGFVNSRWLLADGHDRCTVVVELSATGSVSEIADVLQPGTRAQARSWWCERMETVDDLGLAARPSIAP